MSAKVKQFALKMLSAFAAGAVVAAGSFGVAGAVTDPQVDLGNAPTGPNTLHIHKYENPTFGTTAHTGAEISNPAQQGAGGPIKNVKFKVTKTSIAFNDPRLGSTFKDVAELKRQASASLSGSVSEKVTLENGSATFDNLDNGIYYVEEIQDPQLTPSINGVPVKVVSVAEPFVVILPYYLNNQWTKDVHVYPKNEVSYDPTKTLVDSANALFPDQFNTWEIKFRLPQPKKAGDRLESLHVLDDFPNAVDVTTAKVVSATSGDTQLNGLTFTQGSLDQQMEIDFNSVLDRVKPGGVV
ncbi:MAG: SpaH/EbpB family LPXTG-anchored major pilin [Actinomycetaceae bacterium]|nr:SpaH/EbpB family LPXTG-anchored major pilin [Actinomycetaceae bacterium]